MDFYDLAESGNGTPPSFDSNAVERAVRENQPAALARALSAGADPEGGYLGFGRSPLALAAFLGHASCVGLLLKARAKIDQRDGSRASPLMMANDMECVALLIEAGARLSLADDEGFTAALAAARDGNASKIRALAHARADLEAREGRGRTALMEATICGHPDCVQALLDLGALPDAQDSSGRTALIYAARNQQLQSLRRLVSAGADPRLKGEDGYSALDWARRLNSSEAAELLSSAHEATELRACAKCAPRARARHGL